MFEVFYQLPSRYLGWRFICMLKLQHKQVRRTVRIEVGSRVIGGNALHNSSRRKVSGTSLKKIITVRLQCWGQMMKLHFL
jgi:hypothetical protein